MRLEIRFRQMERSEALEELVHDKISQAVADFSNRHETHIQVWLVSDLNRTSRSQGSFICEIDVRYPPRKDFYIHKTSDDMRVAIQEATDKLRARLNDAGKKELSARQRRQLDDEAATSA